MSSSTAPMAAVPASATLADLYDDLADETAHDEFPAAPVRYDPWQAHRDGQVVRTFEYLLQRRSWGDAIAQRRAAVILAAEPYAPMAEQTMGIRATWGPTPVLDVTCRTCGESVRCTAEDPLYEPLPEGGLCFGCVLVETRPDAQVGILEGVIVGAPPGGE